MDKVLSAQIAARNRIVISGYKSRLMDNPDLTMYDYCKEQNINYSRLIGWMGRHGVSVIKLRHELRKETECSLSDIDSGNAFIQFVPSSRTTSGNLQGISITFPFNFIYLCPALQLTVFRRGIVVLRSRWSSPAGLAIIA